MRKLISCGFNVDAASVELRYQDGSMVSVDCPAVEDLVAENRMQRTEQIEMLSTSESDGTYL